MTGYSVRAVGRCAGKVSVAPLLVGYSVATRLWRVEAIRQRHSRTDRSITAARCLSLPPRLLHSHLRSFVISRGREIKCPRAYQLA